MKILVVEDDHIVARTLNILLSSYNYAVDVATDGEAGLQMADAFDYDLMVLDVILPKLDGVSLCQRVRAKGFQNPILLLTGQGEGRQKAIALNAGADDYVVKPFDSEELVARIQALLRRGGASVQPILTWGNLSLDPNSRKVTYGPHLLTVTPKQYAILELLLRNPQRVLNAKAILDQSWNSAASPGEATIRGHIKEIRQKLEAVGAPKDLIKTVYQAGYRLNPLYSSVLAEQVEQQPSMPKIAELASTNEELRLALEQLRSTQAELHQKNQELETAYQTIERNQQQLQASRDELEMRVAERTAELVRTNVSLQQQQDQWQALFDHALDAIVIVNDNSCFIDVNPAACELFGLSRAELLCSPLANYADPALDVAQRWQQFLQQGQMTEVFCLHRPDGSTRETEFTAIANFIPGRHLAILRDISERQRSEAERQRSEAERQQIEAELRQREDFLSIIYDIAEQAIFVVDVTEANNFRYVSRNRLAQQYGGGSQATFPGKTPEEAFGAEIGTSFRQNYQRCLQVGSSISYEEHFAVDDRTVWTLTTLSPLRNQQGQIHRIVGTVIDITDRKQLELSLQASEAKLSQILNNASASTVSFRVFADRTWQYDYYSAGCEAIFGYTPAEMMSGMWWPRIAPEDRESVVPAALDAVFAERPIRIEYRFQHKDGSIRWICSDLSSYRDDQNDCWQVIAVDTEITERKQLELALQASEAKLSQVLDQAITAIASFRVFANRDWQYDYFSSGFEILFGYTVQELMADKTLWLSRVFPVDRETVVMPLFEDFFAERDTTVEYRFYAKDGSMRWVSSTHASQRLAPDCWTVTAVSHDITDRKQVETALQEQLARVRLVSEITRFMRQTLDLDQVLQRAVDQVRQMLQIDRAIVFRFQADWQGEVITESVGEPWCAVLSMTIHDPCFRDHFIEPYRQGRVSALSDLRTAKLEACYLDLLESFQARACLVVPILQRDPSQGDRLWGLIIAHHCSGPRQWLTEEIELLKQLASQLGIAIQQSELYQQTHHELLERRRMQAALQESEERFRSLSASAPIGILQTDADGNCLYVNDYWQKMSGLGLGASLGDGWMQAVHPEDWEDVSRAWELYKRGEGEAIHEFRLLRPQAEVRWVLCHAAPMQSSTGEIIGYVRTQEDITDRKQAELEIQKFVCLADNSPDFVGMCDMNFMPFYVNPAGLQLVGLDSAQQYSQTPVREFFFPEDQDFVIHEFFPRVLREERAEVEIRFRHFKTGEALWMVYSVFYIKDKNGQPMGLATVSRDITDRKQAEQKIREQAALLEIASDAIFVRDYLDQRILYWNRGAERLYGWQAAEAIGQSVSKLLKSDAAQTSIGIQALLEQGEWRGEIRKFTKSGKEVTVEVSWTLVRDEANQPKFILSVETDVTEKKQLEHQFYRTQRLESVGTLVSGIAHDLNNVFTPILALSQLLRFKLENLDARSHELLELLSNSAERGADLVKQILTFARGADGKRIPLQVEPLLYEIANIAHQTFPKSITVRTDVSMRSLRLVSADPTHLHQVLMNLCVNARDAMPNGGMLTLAARNQFIDIATARMYLDAKVGDYVVITIADTGTGIAPELLDRIFDPFFTTKEPGEGTGLGLSTVLGIVRNHGGFLQVSSQVGKGTQFQVYLPAVAGVTLETAEGEVVLQGDGALILIVDDEMAMQRTNQALLEAYQFRTVTARDGAEAIDLYRTHQHELCAVIMDIMMPNMDGLTAIRHLRRINSQIKIVAVSGLPSNRQQVLLAGANMFLSKPYTPQELLMAVQALMSDRS